MVVVEYLMLWWDMLELGVWLWSGMMLTRGWGGWVQEPGVTASATWAPWDYSAKGFFFPLFCFWCSGYLFFLCVAEEHINKGFQGLKEKEFFKTSRVLQCLKIFTDKVQCNIWVPSNRSHVKTWEGMNKVAASWIKAVKEHVKHREEFK